MLFIGHLHVEGLAPGTAKSYLAAIRFEQISRGLGDLGFGRVCHQRHEAPLGYRG